MILEHSQKSYIWEIYHLFAKSDAISHKDAWRQFAQSTEKRFRRLPYDYYPRGRVVMRNGTATVFLNRHIITDEVLATINQVFGLTVPKIHAEGSRPKGDRHEGQSKRHTTNHRQDEY